MDKKRDWGWLFLLVIILVAIFGMAKGCSSAAATSAPARNPLDVLDELFTHVVCLAPLLIMLTPLTIWGSVRLYFYIQVQWLELKRRRVDIAQAERSVPQVQMMQDDRGRIVLVDPRLATRAVTPVMADEPLDSDRLRAATVLAAAARRGVVFPAVPNLEMPGTEPVPAHPQLRIVDVDAVAPMLREVRPKLAALTAQEEDTDDNH